MTRQSARTAARLENNANNSSPPPSRRQMRYARRGLLWAESSLPRVRKCGRTRVADMVGIRRSATGAPGFAGLVSCGSVWADPVCNAKVMARRALEVGSAVALWQTQDRPVAFLTFTMRHHRGQPLATLWDALAAAWAAITSGKVWTKLRRRYGVAGWLRVVEVTYGENGWHVHVHALLFLEDAVDLVQLHGAMFGRWSRALQRSGLAAPLLVGQDARMVTGPADAGLAAYFTKATDDAHRMGLEFTQTQSKQAREVHKTFTPWHLLDLIEDQGDADALDLWHEWESGSKGRRQITWSHGLREVLGLLREHSDEEIASEEVGAASDTLVWVTAEGWSGLVAYPARLGQVLDVVEVEGLVGVRRLLDGWDIGYVVAGESVAA